MPHPETTRESSSVNALTVLVAALGLLACSGSGGGSSGTGPPAWVPLPLGQVLVLGPASLCGVDTFCYDLEVTCPNVAAPADAALRVGTDSLVPNRGSILLTTGGTGTGYWGDEYAEGARVIGELRAAGFTTIELKWIDSWLVGSEGQALLACRPATVVQWIYDNLHVVAQGSAFCASGNSGGAAQIMYPLTHYGLEPLLPLVVPTGGPPFSRIDWGCLPGTGPNPAAEYDEEPATTIDLGYGFSGGTGPCVNHDPSFLTVFQGSSEAFDIHDYYFPNTLIWLVVGDQDFTSAPVQAEILLDLLLAEGSPLLMTSVAPNTAHNVPGSVEGANLIRDILLNECVPR